MKVAITGASGVVGRAVTRHLVADGHEVAALVRSAESAETVSELGAQPYPGDILEPRSVHQLVEGATHVFNVAGVNEMCARHPSRMRQVNVEGALNVAKACMDRDVERLIHTSSAVTIGEEPGKIGTELSVHRGRFLSHYERSKYLAEKELSALSDELEIVFVNPSSVQGPGRATGTAKLILDVLNGRLPFVVDASISMVDIDDCARGHLFAASRGKPGDRYLISGVRTTVKEAVEAFARVTGYPIKVRYLPGWLAATAASLVGVGATMTGRRPPFCREMVRVLQAGAMYDGSKASIDLGLEYTSFEMMIERTVDWFRSEGLL